MNSSRRNFLGMMVGGAATAAAYESTWLIRICKYLFRPTWVSYRFRYTVTMPPETGFRVRYISSLSLIQ